MDYRLQRSYGISLAEYDEMLEVQDGVCAICHRPEKTEYKNGTRKRLSVDHDHETEKIRGLLCTACNAGIGMFEHNPRSLVEAVVYLMEHRTPEPNQSQNHCPFGSIQIE